MKICIDTRWTSNENSGVGYHIKYLFESLLKEDFPFDLFFFGNRINAMQENVFELNSFKKRIYQGFWKTIGMPKLEFITGEMDLFHFTNLTGVPNRAKRNIVTAHDFTFMKLPETVESKNLKFLKNTVPLTLEKANHAICVSEATKLDLIDFYRFPSDKITVIHNGVDEEFLKEPSPVLKQKVRHKYSLNKKYLLSVSTIEPRKNYRTMIEAYSKLNPKIRRDYDLVIVGGKGWGNEKEKMEDLVKEKNLSDKIHFLNFVNRTELKALYSMATLYLHTSLYEGFGMSMVEAMSYGVPIIASNTSCHPEIAHNGALYYEVLNSEDLAYKIEILLIDENRHAELSDLAKKRATKFSWQEAAIKTIEVYKKVLLDF